MPKQSDQVDPARERLLLELVWAHQAEIWRYLRFLGCEPQLAEDLAQDTFLLVFQRPFVHRGRNTTAVYLRRIARHLFLKGLRKSARIPLSMSFDEAELAWQEHHGEGDRYLKALECCLGSLPEKGRAAIDLRYRECLSRDQMARALGMTQDGVKSLLQRTRAALRACIERRART